MRHSVARAYRYSQSFKNVQAAECLSAVHFARCPEQDEQRYTSFSLQARMSEALLTTGYSAEDTAWCSCSNDNLIIPTVADSHNRCRKQWRSRAGSWEFADKRSNLCLVGKTISVVFSSLNIIKVRRIRLLVKTRIWNSSYSLWYVPFTRLMSFSIVEFWMYQCVRKLSTGIVAGEAYRCWESAWESNYAEFRSRVK